jgi:hypothetical protein
LLDGQIDTPRVSQPARPESNLLTHLYIVRRCL